MSASTPSDPRDEFIAALGARGINDVVSITGFHLEGNRLYVDEGDLTWIDIEDGGIVYSRTHSQSSTPLGLTTIWVFRDAVVTISQKMDGEDVAAGFLKPTSHGGDTAPGWYRDLEGFVKPKGPLPRSGRGPCYGPDSGRGGC
jgi:hypothetical protein